MSTLLSDECKDTGLSPLDSNIPAEGRLLVAGSGSLDEHLQEFEGGSLEVASTSVN